MEQVNKAHANQALIEAAKLADEAGLSGLDWNAAFDSELANRGYAMDTEGTYSHTPEFQAQLDHTAQSA